LEHRVVCANCGTENEAGRKFCKECAARLALVCPSCGAANSADAKFCGDCAAPLVGGASPSKSVLPGPVVSSLISAPVAERRLVSVLFADLVGFTTFAEGRDAEDARELLTRYFDLSQDVIGRYGGTVEKFIGDAVMAVWGAPTSHEDDAERAVRAGLELVDAVKTLGPGISARAGILSGEAAVTIGATNQGIVAGDLVNTASRLQSVAAPGTVVVGEATQRASSKAIAFEQLGDQQLKGKTAPVPAWRALRVVAERGGRKRADTLEAPFVGRDDDLRLLKDLYHATSRERRPRLVSVTGIGGIGKTRLAWEFEKYLDGLVEPILWHEGRSPAYGEGITFWALGEMVRRRAGLVETDDERTTRLKVAETLATHVPDRDERRWVEPALLALLGLDSGALDAEQLFAAWRTFFERLAASGTVVMVFEDLQWADPGLLDFVDHLLEWSRGIPIFVLTLARPELLERRPDWGAGKRSFNSIFLEPLPAAAMRELLAGLVPGLPAPAVTAIVDRADGIPLYAVETVRMLLAGGRLALKGDAYSPVGDLATLAVPETLTALIASRLDGLELADRSLLCDAAVLGQSFTVAGLAAVSGVDGVELEQRLRALVRRELIALQTDPRSPERGQYAFV
jgi:class 3 adenylate cyclase